MNSRKRLAHGLFWYIFVHIYPGSCSQGQWYSDSDREQGTKWWRSVLIRTVIFNLYLLKVKHWFLLIFKNRTSKIRWKTTACIIWICLIPLLSIGPMVLVQFGFPLKFMTNWLNGRLDNKNHSACVFDKNTKNVCRAGNVRLLKLANTFTKLLLSKTQSFSFKKQVLSQLYSSFLCNMPYSVSY